MIIKFGVEEIETCGKPFDPEVHEAVSSIQDETKAEKEIVQELERYFDRLVQSMKECRAWKITGLVAQDYTMEMFKTLPVSEKVKMLKDLNNKYTRFLEIQKIADISSQVIATLRISLGPKNLSGFNVSTGTEYTFKANSFERYALSLTITSNGGK